MPRAEAGYDANRELIQLETVWNERELAKALPGARWSAEDKVWTLPLSWTACLQLRGTFGESLEVGPALTEWAWTELQRVQELSEMRSWLEPPMGWELAPRWDRYPFQMVGAAFLQRAEHALLADEMGTGKTIQVLTALRELIATGWSGASLVICPNSVKKNWLREAQRWAPELTPVVIEGTAAQRRKALQNAFKPEAGAHPLVIVNYELARIMSRLSGYGNMALRTCRECDRRNGEEGLSPGRCQTHPKELNMVNWGLIVVDEAHRMKDPHSQQTRAIWALGKTDAPMFRWLLTGTPIANHPGDLWSLLRWLEPAEFTAYTKYVERYCLQEWNAFGGLSIVGLKPEHRDEFHQIVTPRMRRVLKAQVLTQLPPKTREMRWVELGPRQRKAYDQLEHGLVVKGVDGMPDLVVKKSITARMRQMQFASATAVVTPDPERPADVEAWKVTLQEPSSKLDALEELLEELGGKPVAICAQSRQLIELAAERLRKGGMRLGLITGSIDPVTRAAVLEDFQAGKLHALLFTIQAGGVGLTMTAADTLIFLQRSWSMIDNVQAEDRIYRIGSERHQNVTIIDLVSIGTIEEDQVGAVHEKLLRLDEITQDRIRLGAGPPDPEAREQLDAAEHLAMANVVVHDALTPLDDEEMD